MRRNSTEQKRRLGLKKETLRALSADELRLAAGGGVGSDSGASSLSGSRKCVWTDACITQSMY